MTVGGIVAEFDPFHLGHAHLTDACRAQGVTHLAAVMSGSFTQRGEAAACDKWTRAEMALRGGVDLVLELPVPFATASAQRFARGGVQTLAALGCVERLCFGSECGDAARLQAAVALAQTPQAQTALHEALAAGMTYAAAQSAALDAVGGEGALLRRPNDTLAVEYLRENALLAQPMTPLAVSRHGAAHDGAPTDGIASGSWLRAQLRAGEAVDEFVPSTSATLLAREVEAERCPADLARLEAAMLAQLRQMRADDFAALPDVSEGLENRLYRAAREAVSVDGFLSAVKSKRYTHARLRRILFYALLGLHADDVPSAPRYIHVLGMNERGREILAAARPTLPRITRAKDADALDADAKRLFELECRADDLYALTQPSVQPCGQTQSRGILNL